MTGFREFAFDAFSPRQLYELLRLRAEVFVVEQACIYNDLDGIDLVARHLLHFEGDRATACLRWFEEDGRVRIGRIVTAPDRRGRGLGRAIVAEALRRIGPRPTTMHAQSQLEAFYGAFGFARAGQPFLEDGIPHLRMDRPAT